MDKSLIATAIENLNLLDIVLYESNFKRFAEIDSQANLGQQNKLAVRAEIAQAIDDNNNTINLLSVLVDLGLRINQLADSKDEAQLLYQIEATFKVDYEIKNTIDELALKEFAQFNAVHNVWAFWRQFVFATANQAHLPCPEIPLKKIPLD